jgi:hypothetical protein
MHDPVVRQNKALHAPCCMGPNPAMTRAGLLHISELSIAARVISLCWQNFYSSIHRRDDILNASSIPDKWQLANSPESSTSLESIMKNSYASALVLALSALTGSYALAGQHNSHEFLVSATDSVPSSAPTKTRADVAAELVEARRTGNTVADAGSHGASLKLNELYPQRYPAQPAVQGKSRAQVLAELAEAQQKGEVVAATAYSHSVK